MGSHVGGAGNCWLCERGHMHARKFVVELIPMRWNIGVNVGWLAGEKGSTSAAGWGVSAGCFMYVVMLSVHCRGFRDAGAIGLSNGKWPRLHHNFDCIINFSEF